jgi:hypothetical protein
MPGKNGQIIGQGGNVGGQNECTRPGPHSLPPQISSFVPQMEQMPNLHIAAKYPEVGTPGRHIPVFDRLNWPTPFWQPGDPSLSQNLPPIRQTNLANDRQSVKDAFLRKQNIGPMNRQKRESFNG